MTWRLVARLAIVATACAALGASLHRASQIAAPERIGPPGAWPFSIVVSPQSPTTVYAGLHGGGVLVSRDGGTIWTDLSASLGDRTVMPLVLDPGDPRVIYAGTHVGVFKTTDGGASWRDVSDGLANKDVWSLAMSPHSATLLAGTAGGGVFRTDDAAAHWRAASTGLTNRVVWPVVFDPRSDRIAYAGTFGGGLFRTDDGAAHWVRVGERVLDARVYAIAVDAAEADTVYAGTPSGVGVSRDRGHTWRATRMPDAQPLIFSLTVVDGQLFAGGGHGVYSTSDRGVTWRSWSDRQVNRIVWPTAASGGSRLMAGTLGGGIATTTDRGATWRVQPLGSYQVVFGVACDPSAPGTIFAATAGSGVMKTTDAGKHWADASTGLANRVIKAIAVAPGDPATLFVAAQEQFLGSSGGVFVSRDRAATWRRVGADVLRGRVFSVTAAPDGRVYVGGDSGTLYRTEDTGRTWQRIDGGLLRDDVNGVTEIQQIMHPHPVYAVAVDAKHPDTIYAGMDGGAFRTRDDGRHWVSINDGLRDRRLRALVADPSDGRTLYAGAGDLSALGKSGGVFKSTDGGDRWIPAGLDGQWVLALAVDPRAPRIVYAGTDQGVLYSEDAGAHWAPLGVGGAMRYVLALALDPRRGGIVYAGTEGNSIMRLGLPVY